MKKTYVSLAVLASASAAFAAVDPARPMLTGHGNVTGQPDKQIVTNQTAGQADDAIKLEKFVVTGSLLPVNPSQPMVTGRGNVATRPGQLIVTNQTVGQADEAIKLDKFVVTGSLIKQPAK